MAEEGRRKQLESLTADELRTRARQAGHSGLSRMKKAELVNLLLEKPSAEPEPQVDDKAKAPEPPASTPAERAPRPSGGLLPSLLQIVGLVGGLISLILTLALPTVILWYSGRAAKGLESAAAGVDASAAGLELVAGNLESVSAALESGGQALRTADTSLQSMDPLLSSIGDLMADELPESIEATQAALISAQDSARAMDRVLRGLRLFGLDYDPELPLDQSLTQTAESLNGLPQSLRQTESDLNHSQQNIDLMSADLATLADDLETLAENLDESSGEARQAGRAINRAADSMRTWAGRLPVLRWPLAGGAMLFGLWLMALNLNMWMSARQMRGKRD